MWITFEGSEPLGLDEFLYYECARLDFHRTDETCSTLCNPTVEMRRFTHLTLND